MYTYICINIYAIHLFAYSGQVCQRDGGAAPAPPGRPWHARSGRLFRAARSETASWSHALKLHQAEKYPLHSTIECCTDQCLLQLESRCSLLLLKAGFRTETYSFLIAGVLTIAVGFLSFAQLRADS